MRKLDNFKRYKIQTWLSLSTIIYGLHLIFMQTHLRIVEFPPRLFLILVCLIIPAVNLYALYKGRREVSRWAVVALTTLWSNIGVLYGVHPVSNGGWVLAVVIIGFSLIALYDGDMA